MKVRASLLELAALFLRLGATSFGGPAAHIAMMENEVVRRKRWLSEEQFLDLLGATNLIPGPNSTELAIHIGWSQRRWAGLVVAGLAFIVPAMCITLSMAWVYVRQGKLPTVQWLLYGVKPVMLAVVIQAIWGLWPRAAKNWRLRAIGAFVAIAMAFGGHEIALLFVAGLLATVVNSPRSPDAGPNALAVTPALALLAGGAGAAASVSVPALFWVFFKVGSVLFGSGYVLLAFLRADFVERLGWLEEAQLIDAIAVGQVTPGPVFSTATFIGYVLAGTWGGLAATLGIFLPAFVFVALSGPFLPKLRASRQAGAFLDGVNVASLALMAVVTLQLGRAAVVDAPTFLLAATSALILALWNWNATWLIGAGAVLGWVLHAAGLR